MRVLLDGNLPRAFAALLRAPRHTLPVLTPLAPLVPSALPEMVPGELRVLGR